MPTPKGRPSKSEIRRFCEAHAERDAVHDALGRRLYFAALNHGDIVVGNSSSGLYEAPSFGIPTVNIGDRQNGRLKRQVRHRLPRRSGTRSLGAIAARCRAGL